MTSSPHHRPHCRSNRTVATAIATACVLVLAACGDDSDDAGASERATAVEAGVTAAVAFSPIEAVVRNVGGDAVRVVTIVPPGTEAHEYEPTPKQIGEVAESDVVFAFGNDFQPAVTQMIAGLPAGVRPVDLLDGLELLPVTDQLEGTTGEVGEALADGSDPHVWLDPDLMAAMAQRVATVLAELDPANAATYAANAAAFRAELGVLDQEFVAGLRDCDTSVIVTGHRAFEYLARAYGLRQLPIAGISPDEEPSAKTLELVAMAARENLVTTIYFEENLPDDLAKTVADEIGATTAVLDTFESLSSEQIAAGATYFSVMRQNLATLRTGLGCR